MRPRGRECTGAVLNFTARAAPAMSDGRRDAFPYHGFSTRAWTGSDRRRSRVPAHRGHGLEPVIREDGSATIVNMSVEPAVPVDARVGSVDATSRPRSSWLEPL